MPFLNRQSYDSGTIRIREGMTHEIDFCFFGFDAGIRDCRKRSWKCPGHEFRSLAGRTVSFAFKNRSIVLRDGMIPACCRGDMESTAECSFKEGNPHEKRSYRSHLCGAGGWSADRHQLAAIPLSAGCPGSADEKGIQSESA